MKRDRIISLKPTVDGFPMVVLWRPGEDLTDVLKRAVVNVYGRRTRFTGSYRQVAASQFTITLERSLEREGGVAGIVRCQLGQENGGLARWRQSIR